MFIDAASQALLEKVAINGSQLLPDGTRLIGYVPHVGKQAYLHVLFPALTLQEIMGLEAELGMVMPSSFKEFLQEHNGLILFQGSLAILGWRTSYRRDPENRQPFSVVTENLRQRPVGAAPDEFFIGGYDWDGSRLFMKGEDGRVFFRSRDNPRILTEWPSIEDMLRVEIARLATHYDGLGREIDATCSTLPPTKVMHA